MTQNSRLVIDQLGELERQYGLLARGASSPADIEAQHVRLQAAFHHLEGLPLDHEQRTHLATLAADETAILAQLRRDAFSAVAANRAQQASKAWSREAQAIWAGSNRLYRTETAATKAMADQAQRILFWQALALVPIAVMLAGAFTILIARPIQQIDRAIRRLGDGDFSIPIVVGGPQDLERLGRQLDWLRLRLAELEAQKAKFLQHVSHELKTPLTALREGAQLLADEVGGKLSAQQIEVAHILLQNSIHLQRLIEDLLNFNVTQLRTTALAIAPFRPDEVVREVLNTHKLAAMNKGVRFQTSLCEITMLGDREKFRIIVDNLVSNGIKYSPAEQPLILTLSADAGFLQLDVQDFGPGIEPPDRARVFDAFYQGAARYQAHVKGTGLGLSIAREYVLAHSGSIEIIENEGAHFRVRMPLKRQPEEAEIDSATPLDYA